jgi:riboflavin synthase
MFTGIVEEIGVIAALVRNGRALRMGVHAKKIMIGLKVGDSVSLNGVCLSGVELGRTHFVVEAVEETLKKSSLNSLRLGDKVNLERALLITARLGGHIMTGHIDGIAAGPSRGQVFIQFAYRRWFKCTYCQAFLLASLSRHCRRAASDA